MKNAKVTLKNAQLAFCHQCMGHYSDTGSRDCQNPKCPLYSFNSYGKQEADTTWTQYNPKRSGLVLFRDCESKEVSEKTIAAMRKGLKNKCSS